ncbi:MAG: glycosyltransferase family 4 protein [Proteobacteria bacterium]|nr:glycosyltransferase family 4 protein [Pseudomonadota bacterium]
MNVLELCLSAGLGGLELYVFRSSEALADSSDNNTVIPVLRADSKLDQYFKDHSSFSIKYIKPLFRALPLFNARKLAAIIDRNNIDVIHMHWGKDLPLAVFAKILSRRKPALVYTRQMMITRAKDDFYHRFLYRQLNLLLTITRELEGLCKKFIPLLSDRIRTLYYGVKPPKTFLDRKTIIEERQKLGFSENDFIAGLIGRLEQSKGQHLLIEAIHTAQQEGLNIKALIVGHEMDPGYRDKLRKQAGELGVQDNIIFQDFTSEPQQLMQLCDCIILASGQETFGLVLPEAMRADVAVIGSNSGGVPEIIEHDKTGLLFESQNPEDLYLQLRQLFDDPEKKSRLANQGKIKADDAFNNDNHFKKLEALLADASR